MTGEVGLRRSEEPIFTGRVLAKSAGDVRLGVTRPIRRSQGQEAMSFQ